MSILLDLNSDDHNKTIDRLVELKSNKSKLIQEEIDDNKKRIFALEDLKKKITLLDTVTKKLYDRFSEVKEFALTSSDETVISGSANPKAVEGSYDFTVLNLAEKQVLQSKKVNPKLTLPQGKIKFKINEEEIEINYSGGTPNDFAKVITEKGERKLEASFVTINEKESYFILQATQGGEKHKIIVLEDDEKILEKVGIFKKQPPFYQKLVDYTPIAEQYNLSITTNKALTINNQEEVEIPINQEIDFKEVERIFFRFDSKEEIQDPNTTVAYFTFTKRGKQEKKPVIYKKNLEGSFAFNKYFFKSSIDTKIMLNSITLVNPHSLNSFFYKTIWKVVRREVDKRFLPEKIVSKPTPSRFQFHSLIIERETNIVDDFLEGVTLNLNKSSDKKVAIKVTPKNKDQNQKMVDFINSYNIVIETINIYTAPSLEDLGVAQKQLSEEMANKVGILQSETSIARLKEKLNAQISKVYKINEKRKVIPNQFGVKYNFNISNPYDIDTGKIEFEEEKFVQFNQNKTSELTKIFGFDSNNDRIIDSGLGYEINQILENYLNPNAFFGLITQNLKRQNTTLDTSLEQEKQNLNDYRSELENSFSRLENAKKEQEGLQGWFDSIKK